MTRKLLSAIAVMASVSLTGAITAQAADITFGGENLTRYELRHQSDSVGPNNGFTQMRTRLNAKVKVDENISAFTQFQMINVFGDTTRGFTANGAAGANDANTQVGLHQAYITLNNLFGAPVSAQIGRQEVVLDGHRLFGNTLWTMGAQSHDAFRLTYTRDKLTVLYVLAKSVESDAPAFSGLDENDVNNHILWANYKGLVGENSSTSGYLVFSDFNTAALGTGTEMVTIGARQAGGMGDIDYRGEFYYQTGKAGPNDISAYMLGLRAGYTASQVAMKPKITLWGDYLSGDDANNNTTLTGFNTLYDTGHKFYGLQDILLAQTGPNNVGTGLIDLAIKLQAQPMANLTVKVDLHSFTMAKDNALGNDDIGEEIDITLVHKYSPNVKMLLGFSYFMGDSNFAGPSSNYDQTTVGRDGDASWVYAMLHLNY